MEKDDNTEYMAETKKETEREDGVRKKWKNDSLQKGGGPGIR